MPLNNPKYVIIHHSLTADGDTKEWDAIRKYHIETNGWRDIGYHYGIEVWNKTPAIMVGRTEWDYGAHTKEMDMNRQSLGICVVGNYDLKPPEKSKLSLLAYLVKKIISEYQIPVRNVIGHRDVGLMAGLDWRKGEYKTCPGSKFDLGVLQDMLKTKEVIV